MPPQNRHKNKKKGDVCEDLDYETVSGHAQRMLQVKVIGPVRVDSCYSKTGRTVKGLICSHLIYIITMKEA